MAEKQIRKKSENMSEWYTDAILRADIADYSPVRGSMVSSLTVTPSGSESKMCLTPRSRNSVSRICTFPVYSHESAGTEKACGRVSPELAIVTIGGESNLRNRQRFDLPQRPSCTKCTASGSSRTDLPLSLNQWNNVVRWENGPSFSCDRWSFCVKRRTRPTPLMRRRRKWCSTRFRRTRRWLRTS